MAAQCSFAGSACRHDQIDPRQLAHHAQHLLGGGNIDHEQPVQGAPAEVIGRRQQPGQGRG